MTPAATRFKESNDVSPVVIGAVVQSFPSGPPVGGRYTLENGLTFTLSVDDIRSLPSNYPVWKFPK